MHTKNRSALGVVVGALALAASTLSCGGSSGGAACNTQPCGGDVVGNWTASSACADQESLNMEFLSAIAGDCPTATLSNVSYAPTGTLTFDAALNYTASITMAIGFHMNIPASCLSGATCADVNAGIQSVVGTDGIQSATCTGSGSCTCVIAGVTDIEDSAGTYTAAGTTLTLTATSGGNGDSGPYCVKGSSLHLISVDMSMAMAKITGDIVLVK